MIWENRSSGIVSRDSFMMDLSERKLLKRSLQLSSDPINQLLLYGKLESTFLERAIDTEPDDVPQQRRRTEGVINPDTKRFRRYRDKIR